MGNSGRDRGNASTGRAGEAAEGHRREHPAWSLPQAGPGQADSALPHPTYGPRRGQTCEQKGACSLRGPGEEDGEDLRHVCPQRSAGPRSQLRWTSLWGSSTRRLIPNVNSC